MNSTAYITRTICLAALFLLTPAVFAQDYDLSWHTVDGGGGYSIGGGFEVSGTIGQPDAGPAAGAMTGGTFELVGGFWEPEQQGNEPMSGFTAQPSASAPLDQDFQDVDAQPAPEPQPAQCPGDLDGDGHANASDLAQLLSHYGVTTGAAYEDGDLDGDEDVDLSDLAELLAVYGTMCE